MNKIKILFGFKSVKFVNFVRELDEIIINRLNIQNACLLMNNASVNRSYGLRNAFIELISNNKYKSPYSYMLNPIEIVFTKIKTVCVKHVRNY